MGTHIPDADPQHGVPAVELNPLTPQRWPPHLWYPFCWGHCWTLFKWLFSHWVSREMDYMWERGEPQFPIELGDPWISTSCFSKSDVLGGCFLVQISGARMPDWGHQPLAFLEEVSSWWDLSLLCAAMLHVGFFVRLCLCLFYLSLPFVVESNSSSFQIFFGRKWSICSYRWHVWGGGKFRIFLCCHLGPNLLGPYIFSLPFQIYFPLFFTCSMCREADLPDLYQWAHLVSGFWLALTDWRAEELSQGILFPQFSSCCG